MADPLESLKYAEEKLGVNEVYESTTALRAELEEVGNDLVALRDRKRDLDSKLTDREVLLGIEERGVHPDFSATAMEAHMKRVKNNDDEHREIREQIQFVLRGIDTAEFKRSLIEVDIKIAVSRLQELGGYFQFLAAIKNQAQLASKA